MKRRLEGTTIETLDTYVRITLGNGKTAVTKRQCPRASEVSLLLEQMQGYTPNRAQLLACADVAEAAKDNKIELAF